VAVLAVGSSTSLIWSTVAVSRCGRQGSLADYPYRKDFVVLDEFGSLPFAQTGEPSNFHPASAVGSLLCG
jgi:hypothetical protein